LPIRSTAPASVPPPVAPSKPVAALPASGSFLWSGALPKDAVLTIEGRKVSNGSVTGELPGTAVVAGAWPAMLTNDGIKVFTGNSKYASAPRTEPPGPANGWQKTQFVYDPKALRDLIVEQMPNAQDYKRMVIRATGRRLSVIMIEWQVQAQ
jgi:hypothetical protein